MRRKRVLHRKGVACSGTEHVRNRVRHRHGMFADLPASSLSSEAAGIILTNMADNAAQHGATALTLTARRDGTTLLITLHDNGHGIAAANREPIFQPFFPPDAIAAAPE